MVTSYHKKHIQELNIQPTLEAYIQLVVSKKTLESISLERRRSTVQEEVEEMERSLEKLVSSSGALEEREEGEGGDREEAEPKIPGENEPPEGPITNSDDGLEDLLRALGGDTDTEE